MSSPAGFHRPFEAFAMLKIGTWGQALARCRVERQLSHRDVADRVGVSPKLVKEWELGLAIPDRPRLARLENLCFRQIRYFVYLLPQEMREKPKVEPVDPEEAFTPEQAVGPAPPELAPKPEPTTFQDALQRAREEEGLSREDLGDIIGVSAGAIQQWETGIRKPFVQNYEKLVSLLPSLVMVPRPEGMKTLQSVPLPVSKPEPAVPVPPKPESELAQAEATVTHLRDAVKTAKVYEEKVHASLLDVATRRP